MAAAPRSAGAAPGDGDGRSLVWFGIGGVGVLLAAAVVVVRTLRR
jgi:hypothetical protein